MREILFRGKTLKEGEWVYGSLIITSNYCYHTFIRDGEEVEHEVRCETVGQFTNLADSDAKKIFQHDIIATNDYVGRSEGEIIFEDGAFKIRYHPDVGGMKEYLGDANICGVIGNIFDMK